MLSVSRLEQSKRLNTIIEALLHPLANGSTREEWRLDLVGSGPAREELEQLAASCGVERRVDFWGHVSDEALNNLFSQASVFVMPAVQGYGLPALEALQRRVPVVLHRDSGVSETLGDSPWVKVIEHCDELAEAVHLLHTRRVAGELIHSNMPSVATDCQWAEQVSRECGWFV